MAAPEIIPVAHVIQLAVAPVFLLSGVGVMLTVLTNRLARVVDRARTVEKAAATERRGATCPRQPAGSGTSRAPVESCHHLVHGLCAAGFAGR